MDSHKQSSFSNVSVNDLHAGLEDVLSKFADDTKLGGAVATAEGGENLQRDVDQLEGWTITNLIAFKKNKCWILCWGKSNPGYRFRLGD